MEHVTIEGEKFIAHEMGLDDYATLWDLWKNKDALRFCLGQEYPLPQEENFRRAFMKALKDQKHTPRPCYELVIRLKQDRGFLGIAGIGNIAQEMKGMSANLSLLVDPFFVSPHYPFQDALESITSFAHRYLGITTLSTRIPSQGSNQTLAELVKRLGFTFQKYTSNHLSLYKRSSQ